MAIARRYLIPRSLERAGLPKAGVRYDAAALSAIADGYAREAGLRNFEKALDRIHRKVARRSLAGRGQAAPRAEEGRPRGLPRQAGVPRRASSLRGAKPGMAVGLAWTQLGGAVLTIEAVANPGQGGLPARRASSAR